MLMMKIFCNLLPCAMIMDVVQIEKNFQNMMAICWHYTWI